MSGPIDVYTPWHESATGLDARHVSRDAEPALSLAVDRWLGGEHPLPVYLFGPRGSGKSHLVARELARLRLAPPPGVRVVHLPEDVAQAATADELMMRIARPTPQRGRLRPVPESDATRTLVFLEALDLHLAAMSETERRELRRLWQRDDLFVLATGCAIPAALTDRKTAFYGWFHVVPLIPFDTTQSMELLDRVAGPTVTAATAWGARREALCVVAGGSPRSLVALGQACALAPERWASDSLLKVVQDFNAHYQIRFRDHPPQQQRIIEALTLANGPLTPTEVGAALGIPAGQASVQCRRLCVSGVLAADETPRGTRYRILEPMFRYWLEYRSSPWEESRIGLLARLLEAVLQPGEIAEVLLRSDDLAQRAAAAQVWVEGERVWEVQLAVDAELSRSLMEEGVESALDLLARVPGTRRDHSALEFLYRQDWTNAQDRVRLRELLQDVDLHRVMDAYDRLEVLDRDAGLDRWIDAARVPLPTSAFWRERVVEQCLYALETKSPDDVLSLAQRAVLASLPFFRVPLLRRGLRSGEPPQLSPEAVLAAIGDEPPPDAFPLGLAAVAQGATALVERVIRTAVPEGSLLEILPHPRPERVTEHEARLFEAFPLGFVPVPLLATWGGAIARLGEARWTSLLAATPQDHSFLPRVATADAITGLIALARARPDRFVAWAARVAAAAPEHLHLFDAAETVAVSLSGQGPLHPELEALRARFPP